MNSYCYLCVKIGQVKVWAWLSDSIRWCRHGVWWRVSGLACAELLLPWCWAGAPLQAHGDPWASVIKNTPLPLLLYIYIEYARYIIIIIAKFVKPLLFLFKICLTGIEDYNMKEIFHLRFIKLMNCYIYAKKRKLCNSI